MSDITINTEDIVEIKKSLCFIAGFAHILGKNYTVKDIEIKNKKLQDNIVIDKSSYRNAMHLAKWIKKQNRRSLSDQIDPVEAMEHIVQILERESNENPCHIQNIIEMLKSYGVDVVDNVQTVRDKTGLYEFNYSYNQHLIKGRVPIITPAFFQRYFSDVFDKYQELLQRYIIKKIAVQLAPSITFYKNKSVSNVGLLPLFLDTSRIDFNGKSIWYNDLGMNQISKDDFVTFCAVGIAVIHTLVDMTKIDGQIMFDLAATVPSRTKDDYKKGFKISLALIDRTVTFYQDW